MGQNQSKGASATELSAMGGLNRPRRPKHIPIEIPPLDGQDEMNVPRTPRLPIHTPKRTSSLAAPSADSRISSKQLEHPCSPTSPQSPVDPASGASAPIPRQHKIPAPLRIAPLPPGQSINCNSEVSPFADPSGTNPSSPGSPQPTISTPSRTIRQVPTRRLHHESLTSNPSRQRSRSTISQSSPSDNLGETTPVLPTRPQSSVSPAKKITSLFASRRDKHMSEATPLVDPDAARASSPTSPQTPVTDASGITTPAPPSHINRMSEIIDPAELIGIPGPFGDPDDETLPPTPITANRSSRAPSNPEHKILISPSGNKLNAEEYLNHPDRPLTIEERKAAIIRNTQAGIERLEMESRATTRLGRRSKTGARQGKNADEGKKQKRRCCCWLWCCCC